MLRAAAGRGGKMQIRVIVLAAKYRMVRNMC